LTVDPKFLGQLLRREVVRHRRSSLLHEKARLRDALAG
jgi:hypothetical protein